MHGDICDQVVEAQWEFASSQSSSVGDDARVGLTRSWSNGRVEMVDMALVLLEVCDGITRIKESNEPIGLLQIPCNVA